MNCLGWILHAQIERNAHSDIVKSAVTADELFK